MKILKRLLAAAIFLAILYFGLWPLRSADDRMETFCRQIPMGMAQAELYGHVKEQSEYRIVEREEEHLFRVLIVDAKVMGRYFCEVTLEEGKTVKAKYIFND